MRYVSPKYEKTIFETEDVLLLSTIINIEIEEGNNEPIFTLPENNAAEGSPTTLNFENIPANIIRKCEV